MERLSDFNQDVLNISSQLGDDIAGIEEYRRSFGENWNDGFLMDPSENLRGTPALEEEVREYLRKVDEAISGPITYRINVWLTKAKRGSLGLKPQDLKPHTLRNTLKITERMRVPIAPGSATMITSHWSCTNKLTAQLSIYIARMHYLILAIDAINASNVMTQNENEEVHEAPSIIISLYNS